MSEGAPAQRSRFYPERPIVGVGAIVVIDQGIVLVRRKYEPFAGQWSLPGGAVEIGETLAEAVRREVQEETGLSVAVGPLLTLLDRILRDEDGRIQYHYVLADYLCRRIGGTLRAGSDAADLVVARDVEFDHYQISSETSQVACRGLRMARKRPAEE